MKIISPKDVACAVQSAIQKCATTLRPDCLAAITCAYEASAKCEPSSRQTSVLNCLVQNAKIAAETKAPLCQDTGSVWVRLEVGNDVCIPGDVFSLVPEAVKNAYTQGRLRMSMVNDAMFDRTNTNDNNPAFCEVYMTNKTGCKLHVMLKGGGSDNASSVVMLPPGKGIEGVKQVVLDCVREKASNACPPLVIGVGVGSTFDKVANLAKTALLREVGSRAESCEAQAFEDELLDAINEMDIGPGALGGKPSALALHLKTAPCHIAALPVAVNMGCSAMRSETIVLA